MTSNQKIPLIEYEKIIHRKSSGELTREIAASYGVSERTIYKIMKTYKNSQDNVTKQITVNREVIRQKMLELAKIGNFKITISD